MFNNLDIALDTPLKTSVIVTTHHGNPCVELRRSTEDFDIIKLIVYCALKGIPLTIMPTFNKEIKSINSLIEKGIIYRNSESNEYLFNF